MDWNLTYRHERDMLALWASAIPSQQAETEVFRDPLGAVVYLRAFKPS